MLLQDEEGFYRALEGRSPEWSKLQKAHLKIQPQCMACGTKKRRQVHHIKPYHLFPELELDPGNLITFCLHCHLLIGHLKLWRSYNPAAVRMAKAMRSAIRLRPAILITQVNLL